MSQAVLGVDVGSARIGIAICEGPGLPAVPLTTISHTTRAQDLREIIRVANERGVDCIVVGNPLRLDSSAGPAAEKMSAFIRDLAALFSGQVIAQDERLTTAAAAKKLRTLPLAGSKRRRYIDQMAAVEILDAYVASRRRS